MLLASVLARYRLGSAVSIMEAPDVFDPGLLFPGELGFDGTNKRGKTRCVRLSSENTTIGYSADLLAAFNDYERFANTRELPTGGAYLSPVMPPGHPRASLRIASYPEERYLFARGNLPLPCPKCGRIVHAIGRGPVSSMAEYFEYLCCHPFYYFRPFREWAFDKALYDPGTCTLYHHGHRYGRREFLVRTFNDFRRNLKACPKETLQGGEIKVPQSLNGTIPVLIGRGEFNPGHIIFEDLVGVFLLCEAMEASDVPGKLDVLVSEKAKWFEPLLEILPQHRVERVTTVPSDMAHIMSYLRKSGLPLVNLKIHPCWPHTFDGCKYMENMCQRIVALSDRKRPRIRDDTMRVILLLRTHNRCWEPLIENIQRIVEYICTHYSPVRFVLHAVGAKDPAYDVFRMLAERREDIELLFDAHVTEVLSQFRAADLCIGPIGSGFWWAGLFGVPSVTIHPENKPDTVELGEWILPPKEGHCPPFLTLKRDQCCIVVEEKNANREAYGALRLPVEKVLCAIDRILRPTL